MSRPSPLVVGVSGLSLSTAEARLLRETNPEGVVLLPRNVESAEQLVALIAAIRAAVPEALLFVDAEGGRVDRLRGLVGSAPAAADLAALPPAFAARAGLWIGRSLATFGFDLDFAPAVDLDRGHRDNALDRRTFGDSPRAVTARAAAFRRGLARAGIGHCLKHFPGLGGAGADTHREAAPIELAERELAQDLSPFRRLAPDADSMMVGHASYPALDPDRLPATLSPAILAHLRRLPFRRLVFSDDLEMGALAAVGGVAERTLASFAAGCDGLLVCHTLQEAPAIARRLAAPRWHARRGESARRWQQLRNRLRQLRTTADSRHEIAVAATGLARLRDAVARALAARHQNGMSSSPSGSGPPAGSSP